MLLFCVLLGVSIILFSVMISKLIKRKNTFRRYVSRLYYQYGSFCSSRPIPMIMFSVTVIVLCSLPLMSFPLFEKILAFLFQRVTINYKTRVSEVASLSTFKANAVFAYVQQINIEAIVHGQTNLTQGKLIQNIMRLPAFYQLEEQLKNPELFDSWNDACLKLTRDTPSMKSLKKRIKYTHGRFHNDLKHGQFYNLACLYVSPAMVKGFKAMSMRSDSSVPFMEVAYGKPLSDAKERFFVTITMFLKRDDGRFKDNLISILKKDNMAVKIPRRNFFTIMYKFSDNTGPAELVPLTIAYLVVFFYLWFCIAKIDLLRTRWGLAFSAVMNFLFSFSMAIGICATFDALPSTLNVGEIFPYVVILIGIENFWIITKSVMSTRKELRVKDRVALGLGLEGWYITKNLLVEMLLLLIGYASGVKGIQEFSVFALACYLSDFFLQMTFFVPILAVDTRRAEIGLPFTDGSAWKYAFCIRERPEAIKKLAETPKNRFSAALKLSFGVARYRILQRSLMVLIMVYFILTVVHPIHKIVTPNHNASNPHLPPANQSCWNDVDGLPPQRIDSWVFLCARHWPELFTYYFAHLNGRSLVILPEINTQVRLSGSLLKPTRFLHPPSDTLWDAIVTTLMQLSRPAAVAFSIISLTVLYKLYSMIQNFIIQLRTNTDIYQCSLKRLVVPTKDFVFKLTNMTVDETNMLLCSYNNGAVYVWDLYEGGCSYHIDRSTYTVSRLGLSKSYSVLSIPGSTTTAECKNGRGQVLPPAVWSLAYQSDVLIIGCQEGYIEVYSLENETLQCYHRSENVSGVVCVQIISCLRFVCAHQSGVVEFYHLKAKQSGHKRTNSLPNSSGSLLDLELSRSVAVSNQPITFMQIAIQKIFVTSQQAQVKVLRASDDGGIPMHSNIARNQDITAMKVEMSPEIAIIGTDTGNIFILNSIGQTIKNLCCGDSEVMSICSDDDYIAVLTFDGVLTVWLKEGYIKWWQVNLLSYGGAYEILALAKYSLAAVSQDAVIMLNVVSRNIITCVEYTNQPVAGIIMASPVVCQNKSAVVVPCGNKLAHLQFPKLIDHDR